MTDYMKSYKLKYKLFDNYHLAYITADNSEDAKMKLEAEFPGLAKDISLVSAGLISRDEYENG